MSIKHIHEHLESPHEVIREASQVMLTKLTPYQAHLDNLPARIATFLDLRTPREFNCESQMAFKIEMKNAMNFYKEVSEPASADDLFQEE